jgi:putative transposase
VLKSYKYKLNPNRNQKQYFENCFGSCRFIYNWGLDLKIKTYQQKNKSLSFVDLAKELTNLKQQEDKKWLYNVSNESLQQSLRNLDGAFTKFFREKKGFPKFKNKKKNKDSFKNINDFGIDFKNNKLRIPKAGWVKFFKNQVFEGKVGTVTVSKDSVGSYWIAILVDDKKELPLRNKVVNDDKTIGIDVGIKDFMTLSNGLKISNPKFLEKEEKKLKCHQRRLSRKKIGSKRRNRQRIRVAKIHYRIKCLRTNFIHQITSRLMKDYNTFIIENLNIEGMLKNHCLAKSISSVAWGELFRQLEYKANWYGKNVIHIGRFEPSSKMCSCCGTINKELKLKDREWRCINCNTEHDRDINAAINIKHFGLSKQNLITPVINGSENVELCAIA